MVVGIRRVDVVRDGAVALHVGEQPPGRRLGVPAQFLRQRVVLAGRSEQRRQLREEGAASGGRGDGVRHAVDEAFVVAVAKRAVVGPGRVVFLHEPGRGRLRLVAFAVVRAPWERCRGGKNNKNNKNNENNKNNKNNKD